MFDFGFSSPFFSSAASERADLARMARREVMDLDIVVVRDCGISQSVFDSVAGCEMRCEAAAAAGRDVSGVEKSILTL